MSKLLEPNLVVKVRSPDNELRFSTLDDFLAWVQPEYERWSAFVKAAEPVNQHIRGQIHQQVNVLEQMIVPAERADIDVLRRAVDAYNNSTAVYGSSPRGEFLLELQAEAAALKDANAKADLLTFACAVLGFWNPSAFNVGNFYRVAIQNAGLGTFLPTIARAAAAVELFDRGLHRKSLRGAKRALDGLFAEAQTLVTAAHEKHRLADEQLETFVRSSDERIAVSQSKEARLKRRTRLATKLLIGGTRKKLDQFTEEYRTQLALKEPVSHWTSKGREHRIASRRWGAAFALSICATVFLAWGNRHEIIGIAAEIHDKSGTFSLTPLIVLGTPLFLILWALRIFSRLMHTNLQLMHDANDRAVMAKVFLALLDGQKVAPEERAIVLSALFRPSASSHVEDAAPPTVLDAVLGAMKRPHGAAVN